MSSSRSTSYPWPAQTQFAPPPSHAGKRKRSGVDRHARSPNVVRATIANETQINTAKAKCFDSDNSVYSCWPTSDTTLDQNEATEFVWNSRLPLFTQFNLVDVALFRADTGDVVKSFSNQSNPSNRAGSIPIIADDDWWGRDGPSWDGSPTPFPFYFVVVASGTSLGAGPPQSTFTAVQTALPNSILASMSSSSSVAAASSSMLSSLSATQTTGSLASGTTSANGGNVQDASSDSSFPRWAIAVIVVLGFLALAALIALIFLVLARARRRRFGASRRGSMGSQSPMMQNVQGAGPPLSPQLEAGEGAGLVAGAVLGGAAAGRATSSLAPDYDGASSHSDNLFSGADAAVMAEAFRKALRKPEFSDQPVEEGESPEASPDHPELLSRELAEEGRDIRSVGSSRGVRVETLNDGDGDTATATQHSTPRNSTS